MINVPKVIHEPSRNGFKLNYVSTVPNNTALQWLKDKDITLTAQHTTAYLVDQTTAGFAVYLYHTTKDTWYLMNHRYYE